jgi:alkylated DNA repair dioxygenase AlkB
VEEKIKNKVLTDNCSFFPLIFNEEEHRMIGEILHSEIAWKEELITLFNKPVLQPRLISFQGDDGIAYKYSRKIWTASPWTKTVLEVKAKVEKLVSEILKEKLPDFAENELKFNSCLCNLFRNGKDSMGWHADNEPELGEMPIIASVSLGVARDFCVRRSGETKTFEKFTLHGGSLFLMHSNFQKLFQHSVPKRNGIDNWRINLTFRTVI